MRKFLAFRSVAAALAGSAFAVVMSGCGLLSIESWVKVTAGTGSVTLGSGQPLALTDTQGGFLGLITVDTTKLPGPLSGSITVEDVRLATDEATSIGRICIWGNPAVPSSGTITLNILAGTGSASIPSLDVFVTTALSEAFHVPPVEINEGPVNLNLSGVSISTLLSASTSGSADGLFATTTSFSGSTTILGVAATFALNLSVSNESTPPIFDAHSQKFCGPFFAQQTLVPGLFYGINSKSSYLTASNGDTPQPPLVIALSDVGAVAGDTLHLTRIGTFADSLQLKNGNKTKVSGVFSSTNVVLGTNVQNRIPGAIQSTAPLFVTPPIFQGFRIVPTDIPQDFLIDVPGGLDVAVPAGANYLIVAPFSPDLTWGDNSGFSLGVAVEVK
ncbi:MAG TPA: hypothetical protein VKM54_24445 [Myxococcota bacterium]|nr:hypothetical protein [Myxococcota bacterium]